MKLIYDIQENYTQNVSSLPSFYGGVLRHILKYYISAKETVFSYFTSAFILAEKCYVSEIKHIKWRNPVLIENKIIPRNTPTNSTIKNSFLYSGTISESYGVYEAVELIKNLHEIEKNYTLHIIGHCPIQKDYDCLVLLQKQYKWLKINISLTPIPYSLILDAISRSQFGLISYQQNKATQNRIPTKLYEYCFYGLSIIINDNSTWEDFAKQFTHSFNINYEKIDYHSLHANLSNHENRLGISNTNKDKLVWGDQEIESLKKLLRAI